jgi:hypothetical protein
MPSVCIIHVFIREVERMDKPLSTPIKKEKKKFCCTHITDGVMCTRKFNDSSHLTAHLRYKHLELYDYVCGVGQCNRAFETKGNLGKHKFNVHSDEKPYKCPECDNTFKTLNNVKNHQNHVHSDVKPFGCDHCDHKFKTQRDLNSHKQTHLVNKKYQCTQCEKSFGKLHQLEHHVDKIHEGICVPFECPDCSNEYDCYSGLWRHYLFSHADRSCPEVMATIEKIRKTSRVWKAKRIANDPVFRTHATLSSGFSNWMKHNGGKKDCRTEVVVGLSKPTLVKYLEDNSAEGLKCGQIGVDIDHIRPKSSFTRIGPVEQRELWNYRNLQLMCSYENRHVKGAKFDPVTYTASEIGKDIAIERVKWVAEFGETEGPEIVPNEEDDNMYTAEGPEMYEMDEFSEAEYDGSDDDEEGFSGDEA